MAEPLAPDWLARRAALSPDRIALIDAEDGREITYAAWNRSTDRTARALRDDLGVRPGDRVAVLAKNSVAYLEIWFALGKLGAILQNLNWRLTPTELAPLIADAEPVALIHDDDFEGNARAAGASLARLPITEIEAIRDAQPDEPMPDPGLALETPWVICYTGGTTGRPKGAILTHGNVLWNAINTVTSWGLRPDDLTILNAPLFHTGGLNVFTAPLVHIGGASIVCREFDLDQLFDLTERYPVTLFFGVPTMFVAMQQHPRWASADLSGLRLVISGGAPCPTPIFERFWARGVRFKSGYGLTEAGPNTFWLPEAVVRRKPGVVGAPLFHVDVRVVGDAGEPLGAGEVGELLIRGPHVVPGYWRDTEASAAALRDGWLHTGDLARFDEDGHYSIVGRRKEMIITGGENVYPAEIEDALAAHPAIGEVAVIGLPDERWGELVCAVVVPAGERAVVPDEIERFARERLAGYKIPRRLIVTDVLPMTGPGKIDKRALRDRYG